MKEKILQILRQSDDYVSGQYLCELFDISRQAVWKCIHRLKEEGYDIEGVKNKGYRLADTKDLLNESEISAYLPSNYRVYYRESVDSTNTWAKKVAEEDSHKRFLLVANQQLKGRGRRGRVWESPGGKDIYLSLLLREDIAPARAAMLTLVMGLSVAQAIEGAAGLSPQIKWPNDIVMDKKKVCGILTEMSAQMDYVNYVVIGVGINVNAESFPEELFDKATSIKAVTKKSQKRARLIGKIIEHFEENLELFMKSQDMSLLLEEYEGYLISKGSEVIVIAGEESYRGKALGINEKGELLVEKEDKSIENVFAGEVSVRGIYGYV